MYKIYKFKKISLATILLIGITYAAVNTFGTERKWSKQLLHFIKLIY